MKRLTLSIALSLCAASASAQGAFPERGLSPMVDGALFGSAEPRSDARLERLRSAQPEIIGGVPADPGEYGYVVSLRYGANYAEGTGHERHFCGGSLIAPEWVLTAAHCAVIMYGAANEFAVGAHGTDLVELDEYGVTEVWMHPGYNAATFDYDFALLKLDSAATGAIDMVSASEGSRMDVGTSATVIGWGVGDDGEIQRFLREVNVEVIDPEDCNDGDSYDGAITENMICLGAPDVGGRDSCQGDSGGPATYMGPGGTPMLFAAVSWGYGCAEPELYGVYAHIPAVESWITEIMGTAQSSDPTDPTDPADPAEPADPADSVNDLINQ